MPRAGWVNTSERTDIVDCKGCLYRRHLGGNSRTGDDMACHYAYDTGNLRGCTAKECYENKIHYEPTKGVVRHDLRLG